MPTYEYKCEACGNTFEKFQSIKAAPIRKCPKCGKNKVKRLIGTGGALIFKGSGFYITDYRSEGYKDSAKADAPASSNSKPAADAGVNSESKSGTSGGESKPATPSSSAAAAPTPTPAPKASRSAAKPSRSSSTSSKKS